MHVIHPNESASQFPTRHWPSFVRPDVSGLHSVSAYALATVATAATAALRLAFDGLLEGRPTLVIFTLPIMLSAYFGGWRAGFLATGLSLLVADYFLLPQHHTFALEGAAEVWQLALVGVAGLAISGLSGSLHGALRQAEVTRLAMEQQSTAVQENEERLRNTFEQAAIGIAHVSTAGLFLQVNARLCEILGFDRAELLGRSFDEIILLENAAEGSQVREALLSGELPAYAAEKRYARQNGEIIWVNLRKTVDQERSGASRDFTSVFEEITARKVAEFRLQRLNRLHTVLSKTSAAIVRSPEKRALYEDICRIVVEDGGLAMTAVVEIEKPGRQVAAVAAWGQGQEYLKGLEVTTGGSPLSHGIIGTALRTGERDFSNDFQIEARMAPWCEPLLLHGFRGAASFPLRQQGRVIGALVLFAAEAGYFQEDELELMAAVATAISFGLDSQQKDLQRKEAEVALHTSEANMAIAQRIAHFASWEIDLDNLEDISANPLHWSDEMYRIAGYQPHEIEVTQGLFFSLVPAEEHPPIRLAFEAALAEKGRYSIVHRLIRKDGQERVVQEEAQVWTEEKTDRLKITGTMHDITARRHAEEALRRSEALFRTVLQSSSDAFHLVDAEGTITYEGPAITRLLGYLPEETVGHKTIEFVHPEDLPAALASIRELLAKPGGTQTGVLRVRHKNGSWHFVECVEVNLLQNADVGAIAVNYRDISMRRQAEQTLRENEEQLRTMVDAIAQLAWVASPDGEITWYNQRWFDYTGTTFEQMQGFGWHKVHDPEVLPRVLVEWEASVTSGEPFEMDFPLLAADGHYGWFLTRVVPWKDAGGQVLRWFGTNTDVSERRRAVEEIRSLNASLEQRVAERTTELSAAVQEAERANRAKSGFLSRMSHELRTPLNAILGFGQLLEAAGRPPEEADNIEQILKAGRHLLALINEILDLSRLEAGKLELAFDPVNVRQILEESLALVRSLAAERQIQLGNIPDQLDCDVLGNARRLKQILVNLLANAIKFNRRGGSVTVSSSSGSGHLRLSVTDTGRGIAAENLDRLFLPFERLGEVDAAIEGSGLGLSLSKHLVEAMGGRIGVESVLGESTTFWIELPLFQGVAHPAAPAPGTGIAAPAARVATSRTLLYVEDNLSNLRLIERILARRPEVKLVAGLHGRLGLELARQHRPDLILLDLHLPDLPGDEILRQLRADPETAAIPVVMVSADATAAQIERLLAAGANDYLTKPIDIRKLLAMIDAIEPPGRDAAPPAEPLQG